jgi:hypothetical protein
MKEIEDETKKENLKDANSGCLPLIQLLVAIFAVGYAIYVLVTI